MQLSHLLISFTFVEMNLPSYFKDGFDTPLASLPRLLFSPRKFAPSRATYVFIIYRILLYSYAHLKNRRVLLRSAHRKVILGLGLGLGAIPPPPFLNAQSSREARESATRAYSTHFNFPAHVFSSPTRFLTFMRRHGLFLSHQCSLLSRLFVIGREKSSFLFLYRIHPCFPMIGFSTSLSIVHPTALDPTFSANPIPLQSLSFTKIQLFKCNE